MINILQKLVEKLKYKRFIKSFKSNVSVYKRGAKYYMHPNKLTTDGVWLSIEPCLIEEATSSNENIGNLIKELLPKCRGTVEHPREFSKLFDFVLEKANVSSYKQFIKNSTCCSIYDIGNEIIFRPLMRDNNRGFTEIMGMDLKISTNASASDYGENLSLCFQKCK